MPQMVALFNGMGGGAAALTSASEFMERIAEGGAVTFDFTLATVLGVVIGAVSLFGSFIAPVLQGFITAAPVTYRGQQIVNLLLAIGIVVPGVYLILFPNNPETQWALLGMAALAAVLGVALTMPIGGATCPWLSRCSTHSQAWQPRLPASYSEATCSSSRARSLVLPVCC